MITDQGFVLSHDAIIYIDTSNLESELLYEHGPVHIYWHDWPLLTFTVGRVILSPPARRHR